MKTVLPELINPGVFSPEDLDQMQKVFVDSCSHLGVGAEHFETREAIALAIVHCFESGVRDYGRLREAAIAGATRLVA